MRAKTKNRSGVGRVHCVHGDPGRVGVYCLLMWVSCVGGAVEALAGWQSGRGGGGVRGAACGIQS